MGVISAHIPLERHFPGQTKIPEKPGAKPLFGDFTLELLIRFERTTCSLRERQRLRFYNVSTLKQKPLAPPLAPPPSPSRWRSFCIFAGRFRRAAQKWVLEHLGEEQCDAIFGTSSEDTKDVQATVYIPGPLAEKMAARIDAEQCNRNELILQALREYLK